MHIVNLPKFWQISNSLSNLARNLRLLSRSWLVGVWLDPDRGSLDSLLCHSDRVE
ncbi:hypothetical protein Droror1_Dr00026733, partial [Drosera rotundifolia]